MAINKKGKKKINNFIVGMF